jgi:hypothetical protein
MEVRTMKPNFSSMLLAALLVASCDSSAGLGTSGTYAAKCGLLCKLPEKGPCATASQEECRNECVVVTEGLTPECAQCIIEFSDWVGRKCKCEGSTCVDGYYLNDKWKEGSAPHCSEEIETCEGIEMENITHGSCSNYCAIKKDN